MDTCIVFGTYILNEVVWNVIRIWGVIINFETEAAKLVRLSPVLISRRYRTSFQNGPPMRNIFVWLYALIAVDILEAKKL